MTFSHCSALLRNEWTPHPSASLREDPIALYHQPEETVLQGEHRMLQLRTGFHQTHRTHQFTCTLMHTHTRTHTHTHTLTLTDAQTHTHTHTHTHARCPKHDLLGS